MNISAIQSNQNEPNFNALYVNRKAIKKSFGEKVLRQVEAVLPQIERQSDNIDTFIYPDNFGFYNRNNIIRVVVQKPHIKFKDKILSALSMRPPYKQAGLVFPDSIRNETVGLLKIFEETKTNLSFYM